MSPRPLAERFARVRARGVPLYVRLIGLVALLLVVVLDDDFAAGTLSSLAGASPAWLALGIAFQVGALFASAVRVRLLLRSIGHSISERVLVVDTAKAVGLGASLAIGAGEIYRIGRLRSSGIDLLSAGLVVGVDRAIGTIAIVGTGLLCLVTVGREITGFSIPGPIALIAGALVVGLVGLYGPRMLPRSWREAMPISSDPRRLGAIALISAVVLASWLGSVVALARAVGIDVGLGPLAFAASWVTVATLLPISIGGVGVREAGYVVLLSPYGVDRTDAVALGLIQYGAMLAVSAIAWLVAPASNTPPQRAAVDDLPDRTRSR